MCASYAFARLYSVVARFRHDRATARTTLSTRAIAPGSWTAGQGSRARLPFGSGSSRNKSTRPGKPAFFSCGKDSPPCGDAPTLGRGEVAYEIRRVRVRAPEASRTRTTCTSHDARSPSTRYTHDASVPLPRDVAPVPPRLDAKRRAQRPAQPGATPPPARRARRRCATARRSFSASSTTHAVAAASPTATAVRATPPAKPADVAGGASVADAEDVDGAEVATPRGRAALRAAARASRLRTAIGRSR